MTGSDSKIPVADLHTPEELLATAESLLSGGDPQVRRAVVLEAITALEAFVHHTVFGVLEKTMDLLLVKWLNEKTRMDFDSRLGVLTPVALGQPVDKSSELWAQYRKAKEIRNSVTHSGKRVSRDEARFVLETVNKWLAYLGSTAEVDLALDGLKRFIESSKLSIPNETVAITLVRDYFLRSSPAAVRQEVKVSTRAHADIVLRFGRHSVVVEVKTVRGQRPGLFDRIEQTVQQVASYIRQGPFTRGALVIFSTERPPEPFRTVRTMEDGLISVVVIKMTQ